MSFLALYSFVVPCNQPGLEVLRVQIVHLCRDSLLSLMLFKLLRTRQCLTTLQRARINDQPLNVNLPTTTRDCLSFHAMQ